LESYEDHTFSLLSTQSPLSLAESYAKMSLYVGVSCECREGTAGGYLNIKKEIEGGLLSSAPQQLSLGSYTI
jgi:hypothetical protein